MKIYNFIYRCKHCGKLFEKQASAYEMELAKDGEYPHTGVKIPLLKLTPKTEEHICGGGYFGIGERVGIHEYDS